MSALYYVAIVEWQKINRAWGTPHGTSKTREATAKSHPGIKVTPDLESASQGKIESDRSRTPGIKVAAHPKARAKEIRMRARGIKFEVGGGCIYSPEEGVNIEDVVGVEK